MERHYFQVNFEMDQDGIITMTIYKNEKWNCEFYSMPGETEAAFKSRIASELARVITMI